jgi:tetratricopeptide (TPR) repeat protein
MVRDDPSFKEAWAWLSRCLDDPEQIRFCLEQVLSLDPDDADARAALDAQALPATSARPSPSGPAHAQPPFGRPLLPSSHASPPRRSRLRFLVAFLAGIVLVGGPLLWMVMSGRLDDAVAGILNPLATARTAGAELAAATMPLTWTATRTSTPRPPSATPSPTPTIELSYDQRLILARPQIEEARRLTDEEQYAEAVLAWDRVRERVPEFGEGHYYRARCYLGFWENQRFAEEAFANLEAALSDLDQAIALGPFVPGEYFLERANVFDDLAAMMDFRIDATPLRQLAVENLQMAIALGVTEAANDLPLFMIASGDCRGGILEAQRLVEARGLGQSPSGTLNTALALGYLCQGQPAMALHHIDVARSVNDTPIRRWDRAVILYHLGRSREALTELDELIAENPDYAGYRYYLRALIHYEEGQIEQALEDLQIGSSNTWSRHSLYPYVWARIELDAGDREVAVDLLRQAEASDSGWYGPMVDRYRRELADLGGEPLEVTPQFTVPSTPIPTAIPTITPRWLGVLVPTPEGLWTVDLASGTGPIALAPGRGLVIRFQPARSLSYDDVVRLTIHLLAQRRASEPTLQVHPWVYLNGGWAQVESPQWGENDVLNPDRYVIPRGDFILDVHNWGTETIYLDNVAVTLEVRGWNGAPAIYGWGADE